MCSLLKGSNPSCNFSTQKVPAKHRFCPNLHLQKRNFKITLPVFVNPPIIFLFLLINIGLGTKNPHKRADFLRASFSSTHLGGPEGIRTLDLCVANAALSQLSYGPVSFSRRTATDILYQKKRICKGVFPISVQQFFRAATALRTVRKAP